MWTPRKLHFHFLSNINLLKYTHGLNLLLFVPLFFDVLMHFSHCVKRSMIKITPLVCYIFVKEMQITDIIIHINHLLRKQTKKDSYHNPIEPLMTKATRFLGNFYYCKNIYQANPIVPTVLIYYFMIFLISLALH